MAFHIEVQSSSHAKPTFFREIIIFFPEMALAVIIVNPSFIRGDYKTEYIFFFFPGP